VGVLSFLFPPSTSAEQAHQAARRRDVLILDVRERHEWRAGHAPGSKNIPLSTLQARTASLARARRYIVVCRSGSRSRGATAQLRNAGLDVVNLKGGTHSWIRAGLPLEPRNGKIV
jgi:rhodanese-related sulfurtransferase